MADVALRFRTDTGATLDLRTTSIAAAEPMQPWQMICGARTGAMPHARHLRGGDCLLDFLVDFPRISAVRHRRDEHILIRSTSASIAFGVAGSNCRPRSSNGDQASLINSAGAAR
ncbi:hypothetical protein H8B02_42200 [Bradyrhizobium sp. Pear77]|uniref:hypothetical protein n=1 Tax=Bradyrhizobium altum TaxID=1571202 RepID=UPI001E334C6B|nr:hypothetical protein [Bradyrhizobium altum]MCC8959786.1 hypothetical protein [Bradyrhizobium altum]